MHDPLQEYPESVCLKNDLLRSNKQILLTMNFPDIRRCKLGPVVNPVSFEFQDIVFKAADVKLSGQENLPCLKGSSPWGGLGRQPWRRCRR